MIQGVKESNSSARTFVSFNNSFEIAQLGHGKAEKSLAANAVRDFSLYRSVHIFDLP
jgi:hypothetical protein